MRPQAESVWDWQASLITIQVFNQGSLENYSKLMIPFNVVSRAKPEGPASIQ